MPRAKSSPMDQFITSFALKKPAPVRTRIDRINPSQFPISTILVPLPRVNYEFTLTFDELINPKFSTKKPPRPQNAWVLFRKDYAAREKLNNKKLTVKKISTMASDSWRNQPNEVRQFFEMLYICAKKIHETYYPDYKYSPGKKKTNVSSPTPLSLSSPPLFGVSSPPPLFEVSSLPSPPDPLFEEFSNSTLQALAELEGSSGEYLQ